MNWVRARVFNRKFGPEKLLKPYIKPISGDPR
jgi:hypothetical protein